MRPESPLRYGCTGTPINRGLGPSRNPGAVHDPAARPGSFGAFCRPGGRVACTRPGLGSFGAFRVPRGFGSFVAFCQCRTALLFHEFGISCPISLIVASFDGIRVLRPFGLGSFARFRNPGGRVSVRVARGLGSFARFRVGGSASLGLFRRFCVRRARFRISRPPLSLLTCAPRTPPGRPVILEYRNFRGLCAAPIPRIQEMRSAAGGNDRFRSPGGRRSINDRLTS
jgi:hypothetical protein